MTSAGSFAAERGSDGSTIRRRRPAIDVYSTAQGLAGSVTSVTGDRLGRV
jgi:hypothetical protein